MAHIVNPLITKLYIIPICIKLTFSTIFPLDQCSTPCPRLSFRRSQGEGVTRPYKWPPRSESELQKQPVRIIADTEPRLKLIPCLMVKAFSRLVIFIFFNLEWLCSIIIIYRTLPNLCLQPIIQFASTIPDGQAKLMSPMHYSWSNIH